MPKKGDWYAFKATFGASAFDDQDIELWYRRLLGKLERLRRFLAVLETDATHAADAQTLRQEIADLTPELSGAYDAYRDAAVRSNSADKTHAIQRFKGVEERCKQARLTYQAMAQEVLHADPVAACATQEGRDFADQEFRAINWLTADTEVRRKAQELLKARFGLTRLTGTLHTKKLCAVYELLAKMPEEHVHGNRSYEGLDLRAGPEQGWYEENTKTAVVIARTVDGKRAPTVVHKDTGDAVPAPYRHKGKELKVFNHVMLHELGHAVDHATQTMRTHAKERAYGGWETAHDDMVARAFADEHDIYGAFPEAPREFLLRYLERCVDAGDAADAEAADLWAKLQSRAKKVPDPEEMAAHAAVQDLLELYRRYDDPEDTEHVWPDTPDAREDLLTSTMLALVSKGGSYAGGDAPGNGMTSAFRNAARLMFRAGGGQDAAQAFTAAAREAVRAIQEDFKGPGPDLAALAQHEATRICKEFKDKKALWELGGAGLARFTAGDHVYSRSSDGAQYRYLATERQKAVTLYQWNAPPEWFAELYAMYFAGNLKATHPAVPLFLSDLGEPVDL